MRKITKLIFMATMMVSWAMPVYAWGPVYPPDSATRENWELIRDSYKGVSGTNDVVIARDGNDIYIRGIFAEYPWMWTKGTIDGDKLQIDTDQFLDSMVHFYCGSWEYYWSDGNTYEDIEYTFKSDSHYGSFTISADGNMMTADHEDASFWYTLGEGECVRFWEHNHIYFNEEVGEYWTKAGTGFPNIGYLINLRFKKKGVSGVESTLEDSVEDPEAPVYDTQGHMVNSETARPGIYIHNGKKIVK